MPELRLPARPLFFTLLSLLAAATAARAQVVPGGRQPEGPAPVRSDTRARPGTVFYPKSKDELNALNRGARVDERRLSERRAKARAMLKAGDEAFRSSPSLYEYAADAYRLAAELNPKEERAYVGLGNVYSAWRRYDIAVRMYGSAVGIKPKSAEAHYGLGAAYHAQGKRGEAEEEYQRLLRLDKKMAAKLAELLKEEWTH